LFEHNQYVPHIGNVCGEKIWIFKKIHVVEEEKRTRSYIGSRNVLIITDVSQQNLRWF